MSAGNFTRSRYESNSGRIYPIRVQPETISLTLNSVANAAPTGAATEEVSAQVGKGRRTLGMNARTVTLQFTGTPPDGYKENGITRVPILTESVFDGIVRGQTGTYNGATVEVVGTSPEKAN